MSTKVLFAAIKISLATSFSGFPLGLSDGRLISTGRDHKVKVWKSDGSLESELGTLSDIGTKVAITSGKPLAIAGDWSGQISVYDVTKPSKVGGINSNPMPLRICVD